jgi:AbiV family abortive infection protein
MRIMRIPRARIQEGIDLCKKNVNDFLDTAEILNKTHRSLHAFIAAEFALEEFGKIQILKEAFEDSNSDPVEVNKRYWIRHPDKEEKAWEELDPEYKIVKSGSFEEGFEGEHGIGFEKETKAGHPTRKDVAFVDFDEDLSVWHVGREINPVLLQNLIEYLRQKTLKIRLT